MVAQLARTTGGCRLHRLARPDRVAWLIRGAGHPRVLVRRHISDAQSSRIRFWIVNPPPGTAIARPASEWWADAGPISLYYLSRALQPRKTAAFVDAVVAHFRQHDLGRRFSAIL
jgi:hypothetical protein